MGEIGISGTWECGCWCRVYMCGCVWVVVILMAVCGVGDSMGEIVGDWGVWVCFGAGRVVLKSFGAGISVLVRGTQLP